MYAWQKREAVCRLPKQPLLICTIRIRDAHCTHGLLPMFMLVSFISILIYSRIQMECAQRSTRHKATEQRMNETNERKKKDRVSFPEVISSRIARAQVPMQSSLMLLSVSFNWRRRHRVYILQLHVAKANCGGYKTIKI